MNYSIRFIELTLAIDTEDFEKHLDRAYQRAEKKGYSMYPVNFGHVDESLIEKGIGIAYHDDCKRKKIKLIVYCPSLVINDDLDELWEPTPGNTTKLTGKLDKIIVKYFQSDYGLGDFDLARVDFATDINIGSREKVSEYIRTLHNIGYVKCFAPMKYGNNDGETKDLCFGLNGISNGVNFRIHALKHEKRLLRVEIRLVKKATIQAYSSNETDTAEQIRALAEGSEHILMDSFQHIIPPGDYYKKDRATKLVIERVSDMKLRRRMLRLLTLVKEKKSIHLAIKALNYRRCNDILASFAEIDVSPVTISKRRDAKKLDSLYGYLG